MTKTAADYKAEAARHIDAEAESFARCDTDGFLSQWAHGINGRLAETRAELVAAGEKAEFPGLFRKADGARVRAKLIEVADRFKGYGTRLVWAFADADGNFTGRFLSHSGGGPRSAIAREGFEVKPETAPAWADLKAPPGARGLGGAASVYVETYRTDGGYPPEAVEV